MSARRQWHGTESQQMTEQKLRNGGIVRSFGGAFAAKKQKSGCVIEKCYVPGTWETQFHSVNSYIASLYGAKL